jgi:hypothetical protein
LQEVLVPRKSKETPHLRLRLEPALLARLEKAREKTGRTLTGEIAKRLDQSFQREDQQKLIGDTVKQTLVTYTEVYPPRKEEAPSETGPKQEKLK